jgi:TPR repeat protein
MGPSLSRLYRLAADQGHAFGQNRLGVMHENGTGVAKDSAEAARLYRLAADQGHADARNKLGMMYENGTGVAKDSAEVRCPF